MHTCNDTRTHVRIHAQHGYTVMAEAWCGGEGVEGGRWELRLISSSPRLPARETGEGAESARVEGAESAGGEGVEVSRLFHCHELQEYCLPDRDGRLFR